MSVLPERGHGSDQSQAGIIGCQLTALTHTAYAVMSLAVGPSLAPGGFDVGVRQLVLHLSDEQRDLRQRIGLRSAAPLEVSDALRRVGFGILDETERSERLHVGRLGNHA